MQTLERALLAAVVLIAGCGGSSPTAPTPQANLVQDGGMSWTGCIGSSCYFNTSLKNTGVGCATATTLVLRFYTAQNVQDGTDYQMGGFVGNGLASVIIRPQEIVPVRSINYVPPGIPSTSVWSYKLFATWTNVKCS